MEEEIPKTNIPQQVLSDGGFTKSGADWFIKSVDEYTGLLFEKSIKLGDVDKAKNESREVTHEHVKAAAHSIADSYGKPSKPKWLILVQIGSYVCVAFIGLGAGQIDKTIGVIEFASACAIGAMLFIIEKLNTK